MTRPWPEIAASYRDLNWPSCHALADLCDYVAARPIAGGLHAWTSWRTLNVVQMPVRYPYDGPRLTIEPSIRRPDDDDLELRFVDTMVRERQWSRQAKADHLIERFKTTMRQLNWFTDPATLD